MDIHRPKAAHSIREFLIEIGTIICGILIALGLEQVVETIHQDQEVREARQALRAEIQGDVERLKLSVEEGRCTEQQLDGYAAWARGGPKPPRYRYLLPLLRVGTWETVKTGAVTHMPLSERIALAALYDQIGNQIRNLENVVANSEPITSFDELSVLGEGERVNLLKAVALDRRAVRGAIGTASRLINVAETFAGKSTTTPLPPVLRSGVDWVCGRNALDPSLSSR